MRRVNLLKALVTLFAVGTVAGAVAACGGDDNEYEPPPPPAPTQNTASNDRDEEEESVESRVAAMMETNDRATFGIETRDPFTQPRPTVDRPLGDGPRQVGPDCDTNVDPLGKTELESLEIMGLVTGTALPRAMFLTPGSRQAVIVTEGALAGPDCTNRLVDIRDNQVVFEQITMGEEDRVETVLELNEHRISTRFIQIENE